MSKPTIYIYVDGAPAQTVNSHAIPAEGERIDLQEPFREGKDGERYTVVVLRRSWRLYAAEPVYAMDSSFSVDLHCERLPEPGSVTEVES